ncbi:hypothetical protein EIP91_002417 [Steccherinum ochraceum]|uniref:FAD/NAD(P)-binding domain-containing protein n=1 Tax=Steccherinum ochraceum TaxID=92696 RepID=A0A4R0RKR1_9APHY|nr:hypothetical protein EIP91_002417 [Steccherinum ochraceum]
MPHDMPTTDVRVPALSWLSRFGQGLCKGDAPAIAACFHSQGWFRDLLATSWEIHSINGPAKVEEYVSKRLLATDDSQESKDAKKIRIKDVKLLENNWVRPEHFPIPTGLGTTGVELGFEWTSNVARGKGYARLVKDPNDEWKAISVSMFVDDIIGHEELGHESGLFGGHTVTWQEVATKRKEKAEREPQVLVVGAGQTGLMIAAACKQQGMRVLTIERHERVGDLWRKRYPTLVLHTTKGQHEFLYHPYPSTWPEYAPKDKYADWLETYAVHQDLTIWTNTQLQGHPVYHDNTHTWDVTVNHAGQPRTIHPTHIVMASGSLGEPRIPALPGSDIFQGTIVHGTAFQGGPAYTGKRVIVVGAGNTAIDVCQDLCAYNAASVTMVQRSQTCVIDARTMSRRAHGIFRDDTPTWVGDMKFLGMPFGMMKRMQQARVQELWDQDREMFEKLRKGGLKLYQGPENGGQFMMVFERSGGYWADRGGADLIASGQIKVKQGTEPVAFTKNTLKFADGSELETDTVVFATGFVKMRDTATKLFGEDNLSRIGYDDFYGMDEEYEIKGSYRPTGHPGLWFGTGVMVTARPMAKLLALQLKAIDVLVAFSFLSYFHFEHHEPSIYPSPDLLFIQVLIQPLDMMRTTSAAVVSTLLFVAAPALSAPFGAPGGSLQHQGPSAKPLYQAIKQPLQNGGRRSRSLDDAELTPLAERDEPPKPAAPAPAPAPAAAPAAAPKPASAPAPVPASFKVPKIPGSKPAKGGKTGSSGAFGHAIGKIGNAALQSLPNLINAASQLGSTYMMTHPAAQPAAAPAPASPQRREWEDEMVARELVEEFVRSLEDLE